MTTDDPFSEPGPRGAGKFPSMKQLKGRLLLVTPTGLTKNATSPLKKDAGGNLIPHDRITADVVFLTGDPIKGVLDKDDEVTHTYDEALVAPHKLEAMWISQTVLVNQLRAALKREGMVLGRLVQLPPTQAGNAKAWSLEAATDEDKTKARAYLASLPKEDDDPFA